jgi:hypothetical protein
MAAGYFNEPARFRRERAHKSSTDYHPQPGLWPKTPTKQRFIEVGAYKGGLIQPV